MEPSDESTRELPVRSPWSDDPWQRWLVEMAPPLTWRSIGLCAILAAAGAAAYAAGIPDWWADLSVLLAVGSAILLLRGVVRMAWLALDGTDRPVRSAIGVRIERWLEP